MDIKKLVTHLIGEQIRNQVLMLALENLGFDCTSYTLNISEIILTLIGFEEKTDQLYDQYFKLIEDAVKETSYQNMDEMITKWSKQVYYSLIELKSGTTDSS